MTREEAIQELYWIREDENDLKGKEALEMAIKALEKHTEERTETHACVCNTHERTHACDCISRQEVSDIIKTRLYQTALNNDEYITSYAKVCEDIAENRIDTWINEAKSVEPEREVGHWIKHENPNLGRCMMVSYECSCCHAWLGCEYFLRRSYCPNCGAEMEVDG